MNSAEEHKITPHKKANSLPEEERFPASDAFLKNPLPGKNVLFNADFQSEGTNDSETVSWRFLSKQHWPELLSFYHIRFNER